MRAPVSENQQYDDAKPKAQISYEVFAQLISTVVFVTWILQFLSYLNPKFKDNPVFFFFFFFFKFSFTSLSKLFQLI